MVTAAGATLGESIAACLPGDPMADRLQFVRDTLRRLAAMVPHDDPVPSPSRTCDVNATLAAIYPLLQRLVGPFIRLELAAGDARRLGSAAARGSSSRSSSISSWPHVTRCRLAERSPSRCVAACLSAPRHFARGVIPAGSWTLIEIRDSRGHEDHQCLAQLLGEAPAESRESGSLLGLSTVRDVVRRVGGVIVAGAGAGTDGPAGVQAVTVCLPAAREPVGGRPDADGPEAILVVDGDAWSRTNIAHALRRAGFGVLEADHGGAAMELLHGIAGRCVRLIIADGCR